MTQELQCEDLVKYLSDYIDGDLDEELAETARHHLATCENCRVVLDSTERTIQLYREQPSQVITQARKNALFERIAAAMNNSTD